MPYALANVITPDGSFAAEPDEVFLYTVKPSAGAATNSLVVFNGAVPIPVYDSYLPTAFVNEVVCADFATMAVQVFNPPAPEGSYNDCTFTKFEVWATFGAGGREVKVLGSGGAFTGPAYPCSYASSDPTSLSADNQCWFLLDVSSYYSVKFVIAANSDAALTCQMSAVMKKSGNGGTFTQQV